MNQLELDRVYTVGKIEEYSKTNLNKRITNPMEDSKKYFIRVI